MIIIIHVDDFLIASNKKHFQWLVKTMEQWYKILHYRADLYLKIKIERILSGKYSFNQQHYLEELFKNFKIQDCKSSTTPMSKKEINALLAGDTRGKKLYKTTLYTDR
jgi:hypothetical protein